MSKKILITGSTDGIGLATAKKMISLGHEVLIHGRSPEKLLKVQKELEALGKITEVKAYAADLSNMSEVEAMANSIKEDHEYLDVLINNAGIFKTKVTKTESGFDIRFIVNTIAPYLLTQRLIPLMGAEGRIINLSSAAQSPVDIQALLGEIDLSDYEAYAQSKLAITMWSFDLANKLKRQGPAVIAVNPGSLLGSKMVKEGFGTEGKDIGIGVKILVSLSLDSEHQEASGQYFDNDSGVFSSPHPDALNENKVLEVLEAIKNILNDKLV